MSEASLLILGGDSLFIPFPLGDRIPSGKVVYFLAAEGKVKIGFSRNLASRIYSLRATSLLDLKLIGCVVGDRNLEKAIHAAVSDHRIQGEWFTDCEEIRRVISGLILFGPSSVLVRPMKSHSLNADVAWASDALHKLAPRNHDDTIHDLIGAVAKLVGMKHSRAFEIWYRKARRLEIQERDRIILELRRVA